MALTSPSTLSGATLGERHRCLNSAVSRAAAAVRGQLSFADLERLPEQTPVDRLFKIELAIKLNNVDYVLNNVKHEDMLYVSRALKCKWLVERRDVINPQYLEHVLFPEMVMPAISKMKHWLYTNLTDPLACHQFYQYYKTSKFDFAVKFLRHCDNEFLEGEFPKIFVQITPHYLKVLAEKCPRLIKVYYDALATDNELIKRYLKDEQTFYNSIKCILKSEPEIFLDITEKYHSLSSSNKLSLSATDYILRYHKSRVMAKVELYVAYLLHIPTVAQRLSVEECQEVVIKLARADYLSWWFSYANVEPLVKRVSRADRAAFKKRVFVEKDVGERVNEWPYALPASPCLADYISEEPHVFEDQEYEPIEILPHFDLCGRRMLKKKCMRYAYAEMDCCPVKSELQKLFDEFRFVGFEGTLHELRGRVGAASSADRRRDMLLVLVSKSGGHADNVSALLQLAMRLRNEPVHERAAVVRSLVKRASAWRLPQHVWDNMLEYGHGLGLDGAKPEAVCREGLHAAVMRQFLGAEECEATLGTAFLAEFSTLTEYKLTASERPMIAVGLQHILVKAAADTEPEMAASHLELLLNVLVEYRVSLDSAMSAVVALAKRSSEAARPLLHRLYNARVGRRQLLRQYLEIRGDDAALVNALRHEPDALNIERLIKTLVDGETTANAFFMKLGIYFNEAGGLAERVRQPLQDKIAQEPHVNLARPLATLTTTDMASLWSAQDKDKGRYKLSAALRANMHRARPAPDALALGWREAGMKAVAWRAMRCPPARVTQLAQTLLKERHKRTVRLALALARRTNSAVNVFSAAATIRSLAALRAAALYYRELSEAADPQIWDIVKSHLLTVDIIPREGLRCILRKVENIPNIIKPEYSAMLYLALDKISDRYADCVRRELMKCLPEVGHDLFENVLLRALEKMDKDNPECYPAIVIRYMMLSKNEEEEYLRFAKIGGPLLKKLDVFRDREDELSHIFFKENLEQLMRTLQYNQVFLDNKYQCCLAVIERILTWMTKFLPKDIYFEQYVQIHATMIYFRAVRQSMKQRPEVFEDPARKMSEGVDVVGFTFGRYVVKEVAQLKCQYFESVIELYREGLISYLTNYLMYGQSRAKFISAALRGMLSEGVSSEARLAVYVLNECRYVLKDEVFVETNEQISNYKDVEVQLFAHAEIFT